MPEHAPRDVREDGQWTQVDGEAYELPSAYDHVNPAHPPSLPWAEFASSPTQVLEIPVSSEPWIPFQLFCSASTDFASAPLLELSPYPWPRVPAPPGAITNQVGVSLCQSRWIMIGGSVFPA